MTTNEKGSSSTQQPEFPTANRTQAHRQLELLGYKPEDPIYLRFFYPSEDPRKDEDKGRKADLLNWNEIQAHQQAGRGVYFVVNGGGHKDGDITVGRAIFCEHDHLDKEIQRDLWKTLNLPEPTFQVDTGGKSIHSYWVFNEPIPIADWCELQRDLLEYVDGDRSIKNPSRVMRLAGCCHISVKSEVRSQKSEVKYIQSRIISESGCTYTYSQLRNSVTSYQLPVNSYQKPTDTQQNGRKPPLITDNCSLITEEVPLYQFLTLDDRALIDGGSANGTRNSMGAKLARNLIGTSSRLDYLGIRFSDDPHQLFLDYCDRCPSGNGWNEREWEAIWKSAQLDNPTASLTDEALINCALAWQRRASYSPHLTTQIEQSKPTEADRVRLEIKRYLETSDIVEREILRGKICSTYRLSAKSFNAIAQSLDSATAKPKARLLSPEEFMNLEVGGSSWLIPGIIPVTGVSLLAGNPGAGKTTLAYDLAAAVIYGEEFLKESPSKQGSVLFVSSDEPFQFGQDKMINRGIRDSYKVLLDWDISQWGDLDAALESMRPALVIVDSFNAIHNDPDFDENSALASNSIKKLNQLSIKYSCSIVLIHHLNKSKDNKGVNRVRGSSAIAASVSAVCILEGEGTVKRFSQPKIRGAEPLDIRVELEPETGTFKVLEGNFVDDSTKSLSARLMAFFSANPGTRYEMAEIQAQFPGSERDALYKALSRLTNAGQISKRPSQVHWKNKTWGLNSRSTEPPYTTTKEGVLPPPFLSNQVSNDNDGIFTQKQLSSLDISLDTDWTVIGQDKEGEMIETSQGESLTSLDTHSPHGGEGVCQTETILQDAGLTEVEGNNIRVQHLYGCDGTVIGQEGEMIETSQGESLTSLDTHSPHRGEGVCQTETIPNSDKKEEFNFKVGDRVKQAQFPNETQEVIEVEGNNIRVQHLYGCDWVLAGELELVERGGAV